MILVTLLQSLIVHLFQSDLGDTTAMQYTNQLLVQKKDQSEPMQINELTRRTRTGETWYMSERSKIVIRKEKLQTLKLAPSRLRISKHQNRFVSGAAASLSMVEGILHVKLNI